MDYFVELLYKNKKFFVKVKLFLMRYRRIYSLNQRTRNSGWKVKAFKKIRRIVQNITGNFLNNLHFPLLEMKKTITRSPDLRSIYCANGREYNQQKLNWFCENIKRENNVRAGIRWKCTCSSL